MQGIFTNVPNWIEALAAVGIVGLTYLTLIVLKGYAADTKTIAMASASQTENAQKPFLALVLKDAIPAHKFCWRLGYREPGLRRSIEPPPFRTAGQRGVGLYNSSCKRRFSCLGDFQPRRDAKPSIRRRIPVLERPDLSHGCGVGGWRHADDFSECRSG